MTENSILSALSYHADDGALLFKDVRYLLIRPETLISFQKALESQIGPTRAGEILYAGGFTGGQLSGSRYKQTFGLTDNEAVEYMCKMGREIGWGHFRLLELDSQAQRMVVEVTSSPYAQDYDQDTDQGICHLIRGVLGGLGSGVFATPVKAHETLCLARRDPVCRFEVDGLP